MGYKLYFVAKVRTTLLNVKTALRDRLLPRAFCSQKHDTKRSQAPV